MANRYWVGASGTDWSSTAGWSATDGGASGASVPTSADDVFFTNLGANIAGTVCAINVTTAGLYNCRNFTVSRTVNTVVFRTTTTTFININCYGDFIITNAKASFNTNSDTNVQITFVAGGAATRTMSAPGQNWGTNPWYQYFNSPGTTFNFTANWGVATDASASQTMELNQGTWTFTTFTVYTGRLIMSYTTNAKTINFGTSGKIVLYGRSIASNTYFVLSNYSLGGLTVTGTPNISYARTAAWGGTNAQRSAFGGGNYYLPDLAKLPLKFTGSQTLQFNTAYNYTGGVDLSGWTGAGAPWDTGGAALGYVYIAGDFNLGTQFPLAYAAYTWALIPQAGKTAYFRNTGATVYQDIVVQGDPTGVVQLGNNVALNNPKSIFVNSGFLNLAGFTVALSTLKTVSTSTTAFGINGPGNINFTGTGVAAAKIIDLNNAYWRWGGTTPPLLLCTTALGGNNTIDIGGTVAPNVTPTNATSPSLQVGGTNAGTLTIKGYCRNLDIRAFTVGSAVINNLTVYGDFTIPTAAIPDISVSGTMYLSSNGAQTVTATTGKAITSGTIVFNGSGTYTIAAGWGGGTTVQHTNGTINIGSTTWAMSSFSSTGGTARTLNMGLSSQVYINGTFDLSASGLTFNAQTSNIYLSSATAFSGGSRTYYNVYMTNTGTNTITGNNTFNQLTISANGTLTLPSGGTQTVSAFTTSNTGGQATLNASSAGTRANLSKSSGTVSVSNLRIKDSNATGGATFQALTVNNNTDLGNNNGWLFSLYTAAKQFFQFF